MRDIFDANDPACPWTILSDHGRSQHFAELLRHHAAGKIDDAAGSVGHDQMNGPRRKGFGTHRRGKRYQHRAPEHKAQRASQESHQAFSSIASEFALSSQSRQKPGSKLIIPVSRVAAKIATGQEKGEERIGNTVEPFDKPDRDFRRNPKGRWPFARRRRCSSLMTV